MIPIYSHYFIIFIFYYHFVDKNPVLISSSWDKTIIIWNINTGEIIRHFTDSHTDSVTCATAFHLKNCKDPFLISGSFDKTIAVTNYTTGYFEKLTMGLSINTHTLTLSRINI